MNTRALLICSAAVLFFAVYTHARPYRQKRVSDQRLAELETYMALRNLAGKIVTVPVGFGQVDPAKIHKRSTDDRISNDHGVGKRQATERPPEIIIFSKRSTDDRISNGHGMGKRQATELPPEVIVGRRRRRSAELLLQELLNSPAAHEDASDADAILSDNNVESDEELREAHRPTQQWLPEWSRRVQV